MTLVVYVCASFRFAERVEEIEGFLVERGIEVLTSKVADPRGMRTCLEKIARADVVYAFLPDGVGRSLAFDLGYAVALKKSIYVSHPVHDPPIDDFVVDALAPEELIGVVEKIQQARFAAVAIEPGSTGTDAVPSKKRRRRWPKREPQ